MIEIDGHDIGKVVIDLELRLEIIDLALAAAIESNPNKDNILAAMPIYKQRAIEKLQAKYPNLGIKYK